MATPVIAEPIDLTRVGGREIEVPSPTAWPLVLALGCALLFAGLVTYATVSALGAMLIIAGCLGWFQQVFPHEHEVAVPIVTDDTRLVTGRRLVERVPVAAE